MYSNNNPPSNKNSIRNVYGMELDTMIRIGSAPGVSDTNQCDQWTLENLNSMHVNTAVHINGWNSGQMGVVRSSTLSHYVYGIDVELGGPIKLQQIGFGNLASAGDAAHIRLHVPMLVSIEQCQGEPWPTIATVPLVRFTGVGSYLPVNLFNNVVDTGVVFKSGANTHTVNSIGNRYMDNAVLTAASGIIYTSTGDSFNDNVSIVDGGINNLVTIESPYYDGVGSSVIHKRTFNNIITSKRYADEGTPKPLPVNDNTPSILGGAIFQTLNTDNTTTITHLDDGYPGQTVIVVFMDAITTLDFSSGTLWGNGGVDKTFAIGDWVKCTYANPFGIPGTPVWLCTVGDTT
jgi:hypothetical protein